MEYTGERVVDETGGNVEEHKKYYNEMAKYARGYTLDCACGSGWQSMQIRDKIRIENKTTQYIGGDISPEAIEHCKRKNGNIDGIQYQVMDMTRLPFPDNTFDTYISVESVEHVRETDLLRVLSEARRVLKTGGCYIGTTPDFDCYPYRPTCEAEVVGYHYRHYTQTEIRNALLEVGFNCIHVYKLWDISSVVWRAYK